MVPASLQEVSGWSLPSAASIASRVVNSVCGISRVASSSRQTTRFLRPSASGRAMCASSGVTRWIHSDESRGVSTGTGTMIRLRSPAAAA